MSGQKKTRVQLLRDDLKATRNQVYSLQNQRKKLSKSFSRAKKENQARIRNLENRVEQRSKAYGRAISSLQSDMRSMAERHQESMTRQRTEFIRAQERQREELLHELAASEERTNIRIDELENWTAGRLAEQRAEYRNIAERQQSQLESLKKDIQQINEREQNRHDRASSYYNDLKTMIEVTEGSIPHDQFAPGKIDRIKRQMNAAANHIDQDLPSAAIAVIQQAHFDLMDLEEEVQRKEMEFDLVYNTALEAFHAILENVKSNRSISFEGEEDAEHEADFWTQGQFSELQQKIEKKKKVLESTKEQLSVEEIERMISEVHSYHREQEQLISEAVERIISSQGRAEMGDVIISTLKERGFELVVGQNGYDQGDQRRPYMIKVENLSGTKIVSVISPDDETHENIISINTYDSKTHDEVAEKFRNEEILNSLKNYGLSVGETECLAESVREFYDVEELVKSNSTGIPKKGLERAGMINSQTSLQN